MWQSSRRQNTKHISGYRTPWATKTWHKQACSLCTESAVHQHVKQNTLWMYTEQSQALLCARHHMRAKVRPHALVLDMPGVLQAMGGTGIGKHKQWQGVQLSSDAASMLLNHTSSETVAAGTFCSYVVQCSECLLDLGWQVWRHSRNCFKCLGC